MNILDTIDTYFSEKTSKKEFYYAIVLIVLALGFVIFYYIFPIAKNFYKNELNKYENYISQIQTARIQFNVFKVKKIQEAKKLLLLNKKLNDLRKEKVFFEELTNLLDFAKFDRAKWAYFVKNIILDARKCGLKVKLVKNKIYKTKIKNLPKGIIGKKMSIGLELKGNYINLINFIYKYENMKNLIRINKLQIKNPHSFYVEFTLYGYER